jgi:hypothetical protein
MLIFDRNTSLNVTHPEFDLEAHFSNAIQQRFEGLQSLNALSNEEISALLGINTWCITSYSNPLHQQVASTLWQYRHALNALDKYCVVQDKTKLAHFLEQAHQQVNALASDILTLVENKKSALSWYRLANNFFNSQHTLYTDLFLPLIDNPLSGFRIVSRIERNEHLVKPLASIHSAMQWVAIGMTSPYFDKIKAPQFVSQDYIKSEAKLFKDKLQAHHLNLSRSAAYDFYCECLGYTNGYQQIKPVLVKKSGTLNIEFILTFINQYVSSISMMINTLDDIVLTNYPESKKTIDSLRERLNEFRQYSQKNDELTEKQLHRWFPTEFIIELYNLLDLIMSQHIFSNYYDNPDVEKLHNLSLSGDELALLIINEMAMSQQREPVEMPTHDMADLDESGWWADENSFIEVTHTTILPDELTDTQSWCCSEGCGECEVVVKNQAHSTQTKDNYIIEQQLTTVHVSKCCGADLDLWDEAVEDFIKDGITSAEL